jgi:hypothetical protein
MRWEGAVIGGLVGAATGGIIAIVAQERALAEQAVFASVSARITTCSSLAEFHHQFAGDDVATMVRLDQYSDPLPLSTNVERRNNSIYMARALSLCLAERDRAAAVVACINETTLNQQTGEYFDYVSVIDTASDTVESEDVIVAGNRNPAC